MKTWLIPVATLMLVSCGDDSGSAKDQSVSVDQGPAADQGGSEDQGTTADTGSDLVADAAVADGPVADGPVADAAPGSDAKSTWPPPTPYHKGKQCALPACDPKAKEPTDLSGKWTQKVTTNSHTCNPLVETMKAELKKGHVETLTGQTFYRAGECVYKNKVGGTIVGVIKGDVMITCEVLPAEMGVTPVVESQITFSGSKGSGSAWTYLFNVPLPPSKCQVNSTVDFTRE